jgi:hypothetical protein
LALIFFSLLEKPKQLICGVVLGIIAIKPQLALPLIAICIGERRWKTLFAAGITVLSLNFAAAPMIGLNNVLNYPAILGKLERLPHLGVHATSHASLRGLLAQMMPDSTSNAIITCAFFSTTVLIVVVAHVSRNFPRRTKWWLFALAILLGTVFNPHMMPYDITYISVPAALTLETVSPSAMLRLRPRSKAGWHFLMLAYPFLSWLVGLLPYYFNSVYAFINLLLFGLGCHYVYTLIDFKSDKISGNALPQE